MEFFFKVSLWLTGFLSICAAAWLFTNKPSNIKQREKVPRMIIPGMSLVLIDLFWCIPHTKPILSESLHSYLIPAVIIFAVLSYCFLDYLFSRGLGGFLILSAHFLLHNSFVFRIPFSPIFAVMIYTMGICGLFFSGKPHLLRDLIRKTAESEKWKYSTAGFLLALSFISIFEAVNLSIR